MDILIIDDDQTMAETIADHFPEHKFTVRNNGESASDLLHKWKFDLVITDISFPGGGGERILQEMSTRDTEVIVFTGAHPSNFALYKDLGAHKVISKLHIMHLIKAVNKFNHNYCREVKLCKVAI